MAMNHTQPVRRAARAIIILLAFGAVFGCGGGGAPVASVTPPTVLTITTTSLPAATVGVAYNQPIVATGGSETGYTWAIVAGTFPAWLTLGTTGTPSTTLSGTPLSIAAFSNFFAVEVTDSAGATVTRAYNISINPGLAITTSALAAGTVGVAYTQSVSATGGPNTGYAWSVVAGALPAGITLSPTGTPSATLSGTPTTSGTANFTVQVQDPDGGIATQALSLSFTPAMLAIDSPSVDEGSTGTTTLRFSVVLSTVLAIDATVDYATADATATAPSDYAATSGTLTFPAGTTTQLIDVPVVGDLVVEPTETFTVTLSNPTIAAIAKATGTGAIRNDDGVGDFNGDGFPDVIIGASRATTAGASQAGEAYLYFGSLTPATTITPTTAGADLTFTGSDPVLGLSQSRELGTSVALGDVNGDGFADAIIGDVAADFPGGFDTGGVYVFFGGPGKTGAFSTFQADVILAGPADTDRMGARVTVGDFNGDGIDDILAGAPGFVGTGSGGDKAYVFFGATTLAGTITTPDVIFSAVTNPDKQFGAAVAAGDVNGDGFDDALIGEPGNSAAYLFYGNAALSGTIATAIADVAYVSSNGYGTAVALGDTNDDGFAELLIGAPVSGRAFLYRGSATFAGGPPETAFAGIGFLKGLGENLAIADHNGDGFGDVILTASREVSAGGSGEVYAFFGGTLPWPSNISVANADRTIFGDTAGETLGKTFGVGDLDGDGRVEVFAGASASAWLHMVPGAASPPAIEAVSAAATLTFTGKTATDEFGSGVAGSKR